MKVYLLQYWNYEDSETQGVYTEDAMKREKAGFTEEGRKMHQRTIESKREQIAGLEKQKKQAVENEAAFLQDQHNAKDAGHKDAVKRIQKLRKPLIKEIERLSHSISILKKDVQLLEERSDEQLCDDYMHRAHLTFEEFYVLE